MDIKINTNFDLPRMVLIEKLHPFFKIITKSLECPHLSMEVYHYNKDFIVYQESVMAGAAAYGISSNIVLARVLYFDFNRLKWLENEAISPGIISRSDWHWLAMNYENYYVAQRGGYITTTGLLFVHETGKFELIKSLINFKNFFIDCNPYFSRETEKDILISDHLPVRKCFTSYVIDKKDKKFIAKLVNDEKFQTFYHQRGKAEFFLDIARWQRGEKNIMSGFVNFKHKSNDLSRGVYA